jgi:hypothetical protein
MTLCRAKTPYAIGPAAVPKLAASRATILSKAPEIKLSPFQAGQILPPTHVYMNNDVGSDAVVTTLLSYSIWAPDETHAAIIARS